MSSPFVFFLGSISLAFGGWLQVQFSSILGLVESHFACLRLSYKILRAIQDDVRKAFRLPFDQIVRLDGWVKMVPFPPITMLVFMLYLKRSFISMRGFCLPQEVCGRRLVFSLGGVFTCFMCISHHSWEDSSTTHFRQCLTLRRVNEFNRVVKAF